MLKLALLALSVGLLSAPHAKASTIDTFSLAGDGNVFTFSLTSPSTPASCDGFGDVCYSGVMVLDNGHSQADTIEFTHDNGISIFNSHGQTILELSLNAPQPDFFTNNGGVITFIGGTFHLSGVDNGYANWDYNGKMDCDNYANYTLVLDPPPTSPVPEPSSLALMSTGLLAAAGALRSRMKK